MNLSKSNIAHILPLFTTFRDERVILQHHTIYHLPLNTPISGTNTRRILEDFDMFFYVVSRTYAEIFSLLRICSGLLSNSPGLNVGILICRMCKLTKSHLAIENKYI